MPLTNQTLFLDRDGVVNHEIEGSYVNTWNEFQFYDGAKAAFKIFAEKFKYIIVITNQRGVGRGITTLENLHLIHQNMVKEIEQDGGRIDAIYFCTDADKESPNRKPNTGMALQAKKDFPAIDFTQSIMVGNNISDLNFGRNIGAKVILLTTTTKAIMQEHGEVQGVYDSLYAFATSL